MPILPRRSELRKAFAGLLIVLAVQFAGPFYTDSLPFVERAHAVECEDGTCG